MSSLFRYQITIEYDGTEFSGWQRQKSVVSVQECIEKAIFGFTNENVVVYGAGRTDAGVHAVGQVAHFDLHREFEPYVVVNAINHFLKPYQITAVNGKRAPCDFHARFDAKEKTYLYKILNRPAPSALMGRYSWHIKENLDIDAMQSAASLLVGPHDFSSFRGAGCQAKSPIKTINGISIIRNGEIIEIYISARSFLYNQVRITVGCLRKIGNGRMTHEQLHNILLSKNRKNAAETAPAHGLYLLRIFY